MDAVTYPHGGVERRLAEAFVAFRPPVDLEKERARKFGVVWTPGLLFLDGLENVHYRAYGYYPPEEFEHLLHVGHGMVEFGGGRVSSALPIFARATCQIYKTHREDLLNMKMAPANVAGEEGTRRLMQLIRVWSSQKHAHIQFNILNKQSLLDAQKNPEKYRDLVVRVAGYCAYFVDLTPKQQEELIARTEERIG